MIIVLIGFLGFLFAFSFAIVLLSYVGWGLCLLVSVLYRRLPVGWDDHGRSAPERWFDKHGNKVVGGFLAVGSASILIFVYVVVPSWGAERDRKAPREFMEAWGSGGQHGGGAYALYDDRADFRDSFFEAYAPTSVVDVKEDGDGTLTTGGAGYGPVQEMATIKTRQFVVVTRGVAGWGVRDMGAPMAMTFVVKVAKDTHKVCGVRVLSEEKLASEAAPVESAVSPPAPGPTVLDSTANATATEVQMARLRQEVEEVRRHEDLKNVLGLARFLSESAAAHLSDRQAAGAQKHSEGQFLSGMYYVFGQADEDKRAEGIWMLKEVVEDMPEAGYWLAMACIGGAAGPKSVAEAEKWFLLAAQKGHVRAQYSLGLLYMDATLTMLNPDKAMGWLAMAAKQGLPEAEAEFARRWREENRVVDGKLPAGFTRIELGADGKVEIGR